MARIPRGQAAGHSYHVLNRGNGGATVFHKDGDYAAFLHLLGTAKTKFPVKVLGFCLMPNHFHLVVQPETDAALSPFMQWWMTSHVRRYHQHYQGHGHVWQGRFKSFPIQQDDHLTTEERKRGQATFPCVDVRRSATLPLSCLAFLAAKSLAMPITY